MAAMMNFGAYDDKMCDDIKLRWKDMKAWHSIATGVKNDKHLQASA